MPGVDGRFRIGETELGPLLTRWLNLLERDGSAIRLLLAAADRDDSPVNLRAHVIGLNVAADWWHKNRFDGHIPIRRIMTSESRGYSLPSKPARMSWMAIAAGWSANFKIATRKATWTGCWILPAASQK